MGLGLTEISSLELVELTGEDRLRFLNGQVTADVGGLEPGQGAYGFVTTPKGRILADFVALAMEERTWLAVPRGRGAAVVEQLSKYIIADRVEPRVQESHGAVALLGEGAREALGRLGVATPPLVAYGHAAEEILGAEAVVQRFGGAPLSEAVEGWTAWLPMAAREDWLEGLRKEIPQVDNLGTEAFEDLRIAHGRPRFGADFDEGNLPQETGLDEAVSYTKGCYLGQEIVARLHYRGQVARQVRRLAITGGEAPQSGAELLFEGRRAGTLTSVARVPDAEGRTPALGMVQRRAFEEGTVLQVASPEGESAGPEAVVLSPAPG